jgi:hypothetical protein
MLIDLVKRFYAPFLQRADNGDLDLKTEYIVASVFILGFFVVYSVLFGHLFALPFLLVGWLIAFVLMPEWLWRHELKRVEEAKT